jgi:phosphatidylglycerol lysyltransferase
LRALPVLISLALFVAALQVLRVELRAVRWRDLEAELRGLPATRLWLALALTALNYIALTGYDFLAFSYIGMKLRRRQIAGASFVAYAISHNVGFAMLSGASVRYRFYSRWGVTAEDLSRIIFSYSITFWLGLCALGGLSLVISPIPAALGLPGSRLIPFVGWSLMLAVVASLGATTIRRKPVRLFSLSLPLPRPALAVQQLLVSSVDWALAAAVLYVLLPPGALPFLTFVGLFLVAVLMGMVSHVPGGIGVFEGLMVLLMKPYIPSERLIPVLVVYRAIYYLLPFLVAVIGLTWDEARRHRAHLTRAGEWLGNVTEQFAARVMAVLTFDVGAVLLLSGATPASPGRLDLINRILPLGVVEVSHFAGSVAGAGLIVLSNGLARRLDAAYYLSSMLMLVGIGASLFKGFDYEEAALLAIVLVILHRVRPAFNRRAAFFATRFSGSWLAALAGTIAASLWLGLFAFKHVNYAHELWWRFEWHGEASRFLRASVGATMVVLLVGVTHLIRPAPHEVSEPTDAELADAAAVIAHQTVASANLVYLRDKGLIFSDARDAFLMYGVQGRTWVALGDPVGNECAKPELINRFLERCNDYGGVPVFYQVGPAHLHKYADVGLAFVKLGEEAVVNLSAFSLDGGRNARYRQALRRLEKNDATFRVVPAEAVAALLPQLRVVSDAWLKERAGSEKGFSLGFFDEGYLQRFPVAVVERENRIVAFCNVWPGAQGVELSLDLMRYSSDAPKDVMESLIVHLMIWGQQHGYRRFALGMAPLSGFEQSPVASIWHRLGALLYQHGGRVYSFRGLRAFKEKFGPEWEPRYLAYPGGWQLPRVLADTAALIAGGYRNIFLK